MHLQAVEHQALHHLIDDDIPGRRRHATGLELPLHKAHATHQLRGRNNIIVDDGHDPIKLLLGLNKTGEQGRAENEGEGPLRGKQRH